MSRKLLKRHVQDAAFKKLLEAQKGHKKMDHKKYQELKLHPYLQCELLKQKDRKMLALLCSQCVRVIRMNFEKMYKNSLVCPLDFTVHCALFKNRILKNTFWHVLSLVKDST